MMTQMDHEYFEKMLEAQFKNVHDKIDHVIKLQQIANGRTSKNEESIDKLNDFWAESRGSWRAATAIGSMIGAFIGYIIALWLKS